MYQKRLNKSNRQNEKKLFIFLLSALLFKVCHLECNNNKIDYTSPKFFNNKSKQESFKVSYKESQNIGTWFNFCSQNLGESNILTLKYLSKEASISELNYLYPEPEFPTCPCSLADLKLNPDFKNYPFLNFNPNCKPILKKVSLNQKLILDGEEIVIINSILTYNDNIRTLILRIYYNNDSFTKNQCRLVFKDTSSKIFETCSWSYIQLNINISKIDIRLNFWSNENIQESLSLPIKNLYANSEFELVVAGVESSNCYVSASGFIGAYLNLQRSNSCSLNHYMDWIFENKQINYYDILFLPLIKPSVYVVNTDKKLKIEGTEENIKENLYKTGIDFLPGNFITLNDFGHKIKNKRLSFIKSFYFYLDFSYQEPLPDKFVIFQIGEKQNKISFFLKTQNNSRILFCAIGEDINKQFVSFDLSFENKIKYRTMIGVSLGPTSQIAISLYDLKTIQTKYMLLTKKFKLNSKKLTLLDRVSNPEITYNGRISIGRMILMDSGNFLLNSLNRVCNQKENHHNKYDNCLLFSESHKSLKCLSCNSGYVLFINKCVKKCKKGYHNYGSDICYRCKSNSCDEFNNLNAGNWYYAQIDQHSYNICPSKQLINPITQLNKAKNNLDFNSKIKFQSKVTVNNLINCLKVDFDFQGSCDNISVDLTWSKNLSILDKDKIALQNNNYTLIFSEVCVVSSFVELIMKALAWTVLILFFIFMIVIIIISIFGSSLIHGLGEKWKIAVHIWIRLQLVSVLTLLSVRLPCCTKIFLNELYRITVYWLHGLSGVIYRINSDSISFVRGFYENLPFRFKEVGTSSFFIPNMSVGFIVLGLFIIFVVVIKIWDKLKPVKGRRRFIILLFCIFSGIIGFVGIMYIPIILFAVLNLKLAIFIHSIFTASFILSIVFIVVIALFILFCLYRLLGNKDYLFSPVNTAKYYYFFAGNKKNSKYFCYDIFCWVAWLIVAVMLGALLYFPRIQILVILFTLVAVFILCLIIKPMESTFYWICELISLLLIIIALILITVIAFRNKSNCSACKSSGEGICLAIVALFFASLLILLVGNLIYLFMSMFCKKQSWVVGADSAAFYSSTTCCCPVINHRVINVQEKRNFYTLEEKENSKLMEEEENHKNHISINGRDQNHLTIVNNINNGMAVRSDKEIYLETTKKEKSMVEFMKDVNEYRKMKEDENNQNSTTNQSSPNIHIQTNNSENHLQTMTQRNNYIEKDLKTPLETSMAKNMIEESKINYSSHIAPQIPQSIVIYKTRSSSQETIKPESEQNNIKIHNDTFGPIQKEQNQMPQGFVFYKKQSMSNEKINEEIKTKKTQNQNESFGPSKNE